MTNTTYRVGDNVRAFHPRTLGVVKTGRVVTIGPKFAKVDFGAIWGGPAKVRLQDILDYAE
jgi:hypothetical protein